MSKCRLSLPCRSRRRSAQCCGTSCLNPAGEAPALKFADRVLKQLARELLLAQSSDWAFLMKTGTAREYATRRTIDHLARFNRLCDQLVTNTVDEEFLRECEWRDNLFPNVNWRYYV
jgi:predicted glycosyl hydrolase (DUF1957 family)